MSACLLFACLSIAWAQSPRVNPFANDADAAEAGRAQFRLRCAPCHGFKGEGGRGPDLTLGVYNAGNTDEDGTVLAVNCNCFYLDDKGATANPPGSLWKIVPADKVPAGAEVAKTKK